MIAVDCAAFVPGVPPERLLAWWSDFREGKSDHAWVRRKILAREGPVTTMEDRAVLMRERTTATVRSDRVSFDGLNTYSQFWGEYVFAAEGAGTRVTLHATIELKRAWRPFEFVARPIARALVRADLRYHARVAARDAAP